MDLLELFQNAKNKKTYLKISAPMVRYSRLPFRRLVSQYGVDVTFSPMILADSFHKSEKARNLEFQLSAESTTPTILQFASSNTVDFVKAYALAAPHVAGVDINCGCPQRWAIQQGIGSAMLFKPELIRDMVVQARNSTTTTCPISVKIRLLPKEEDPLQCDIKASVDLARQIEMAGASILTLHGRTPKMRSHLQVDYSSMKIISQSIGIPLISNGDCFSSRDADEIHHKTDCLGVMSARGLLENPTLFSGTPHTTWECVDRFIDLTMRLGAPSGGGMKSQIVHHHLVEMMSHGLLKKQNEISLLSRLSSVSVPMQIELLSSLRQSNQDS